MTYRGVYWVAKPLKDAKKYHLGTLSKWNPNWCHEAVIVGTFDESLQKVTDCTIFELEQEEENWRKVKPPKITKADSMKGWRGAGMFLNAHEEEPGMTGITTYTDKEIESFAIAIIAKHGKYDPGANSCRDFASDLFHKICNVDESLRARIWHSLVKQNHDWGEGSSWKGLKKTLFVCGALAAIGVISGVAWEHAERKEEKRQKKK